MYVCMYVYVRLFHNSHTRAPRRLNYSQTNSIANRQIMLGEILSYWSLLHQHLTLLSVIVAIPTLFFSGLHGDAVHTLLGVGSDQPTFVADVLRACVVAAVSSPQTCKVG